MAGNRARIDRRLAIAPATVAEQPTDAVVVFRDAWGAVTKHYDLGSLPLPRDVVLLLADAFRHHHAASRPATQRHCWRALRIFSRFAAEDGAVHASGDLTTAMVGRYIDWLDRQKSEQTERPWTKGSRADLLGQLRQLIDWTKRRHPTRLPARIDFPYGVYPDRQPGSRPHLSAEQLKVILRACYEEIDEAWERFETGRAILGSKEAVANLNPELCRLIRKLAEIGGGVLPPQIGLAAHGIGMAAITRQGGLRSLGSYLHLTGETLAPFFIALAIQTAANPDALRLIARDCQVPHPLDENRIIIEWGKPRAGSKFKRAQRRSFDRRRRYAAPNLINKLLAMTAPLAAQASSQERHRLFLLRSEKKSTVMLVPEGTLSQGVKQFISRSNARIAIWNKAAPERPRAPIPGFAAAFLRGSIATEHYKASGGDIVAVQEVLNHARPDTTEIYVKGPEARRVQRETIARLQDLMIGWIMGETNRAKGAAPNDTMAPGAAATAPFGHLCLNPLAGTAPGTTAGRVCRYFGGCLLCPGLVVPIDAEHMARILQAKREFERARERLDPRRWELLYAPSYRILVADILPDFPETLRPAAEAQIPTLPLLPALE
jgi:integrase